MERLTFDVFHHKIENAFTAFAKVGDANGIRMLYRRCRLCLAFEADDRFAFLQVVAVEDILTYGFHRYFPVLELRIFCEIYLPHRSSADPLFEEISTGEHPIAG